MSKQLILNPVENLPHLIIDAPPFDIHGLYVSDKVKTDKIVKDSIIGFSGRETLNEQVRMVYSEWCRAMQAENLSMRLLSGLHAHIILFMGLGNIGDKVLLLPEVAGGHYATKKILNRLGYQVLEMEPDYGNYKIDISRTLEIACHEKPELVFVDRSEGIYYEDFSELTANLPNNCGKIFDGSQYLTNIMMQDFQSPFDMGFEIIMATLHKNFPGPQKAMVCTNNENGIYWRNIVNAMSDYVSSLHVDNILMAGSILEYNNLLRKYSQNILLNSILLEKYMCQKDIPIIQRDGERTPTHHLWLKANNANEAFSFYKKMEECGILVNYRKLPYQLGHGIRLGTAAATLQGLNKDNIETLVNLIKRIYVSSVISDPLKRDCGEFISSLTPLPETYHNGVEEAIHNGS